MQSDFPLRVVVSYHVILYLCLNQLSWLLSKVIRCLIKYMKFLNYFFLKLIKIITKFSNLIGYHQPDFIIGRTVDAIMLA